jgi:hypothetical protein
MNIILAQSKGLQNLGQSSFEDKVKQIKAITGTFSAAEKKIARDYFAGNKRSLDDLAPEFVAKGREIKAIIESMSSAEKAQLNQILAASKGL